MRKEVNIHIGEYHASANPAIIHTVLGSCVAACLFDFRNLIGGMNHILLPGKAYLKHFDVSARYGVNAMDLLINRMMRLGADRKSLQAKVFGGAHVLPSISRENGVGEKISAFVMEFMQMENIRLINSDTGGTESRKVLYYTDTGDAYVKKLPSLHLQKIARKEKHASKRVRDIARKPGDITLFED